MPGPRQAWDPPLGTVHTSSLTLPSCPLARASQPTRLQAQCNIPFQQPYHSMSLACMSHTSTNRWTHPNLNSNLTARTGLGQVFALLLSFPASTVQAEETLRQAEKTNTPAEEPRSPPHRCGPFLIGNNRPESPAWDSNTQLKAPSPPAPSRDACYTPTPPHLLRGTTSSTPSERRGPGRTRVAFPLRGISPCQRFSTLHVRCQALVWP